MCKALYTKVHNALWQTANFSYLVFVATVVFDRADEVVLDWVAEGPVGGLDWLRLLFGAFLIT